MTNRVVGLVSGASFFAAALCVLAVDVNHIPYPWRTAYALLVLAGLLGGVYGLGRAISAPSKKRLWQ